MRRWKVLFFLNTEMLDKPVSALTVFWYRMVSMTHFAEKVVKAVFKLRIGGVKNSDLDREGSKYGIEDYME
jgi:hypothetical protein